MRTFDLGRVVIIRIGPAGGSVDPSVAQTLDDHLVRDVQRQNNVDVEEVLQLDSLVGGAGEAIQQHRLACRQLGKLLLEDVQNNLVRNQLAGLHVGLGSQTNICFLSDIFAQQVTSGNLKKSMDGDGQS